MDMRWLLWIAGGYLCGSIPFALLLGKAHGIDVRQVGSGNVGATNLGRALGRRWGIVCFVLDVLKGLLPVLIAGLAMGAAGRWEIAWQEALPWLLVATAAMTGHIFPVWLRFKGGKGVATGLGAVLGFWPILTIPGLAAAVTWVALVSIWRYVSLASIIAAMAMPAFLVASALWADQPVLAWWPMLAVTAAMAVLITLKHRANLGRIRAGTEPKIGEKSKGASAQPPAVEAERKVQ